MGEPGVAGVLVKLLDCAGHVLRTTNTDANGLYLFADLVPGGYTVMFTAPAGYVLTARDAGGDDAKDSDADRASGLTGCYTLVSGQTNLTVDAGVYPIDSNPSVTIPGPVILAEIVELSKTKRPPRMSTVPPPLPLASMTDCSSTWIVPSVPKD